MEKKVSSISVLAAYSGRDNGYIFCHDDVRYRGGRVFQVRHFFFLGLGEARFRVFLRATREGAPSFFSWAARVAPRVFRAFEMTLPWRRPRESCARGSRSTTRTPPLCEKDKGTKLEALYAAYASAAPPVHAKVMGRNNFAKMLGAVYAGIGPHKSARGTVGGLYLLRHAID